jgi:Family of unknown function (DUF6011)
MSYAKAAATEDTIVNSMKTPSNRITNDATILGDIFGLDMDITTSPSDAPTNSLLCSKCNGKGKFIGYSGRIVGNCFACEGTGLDRAAGVVVAEGDCTKCLGTGAWRPGRPCFACNSTGKISAKTSAVISVEAIVKAFEAAHAVGKSSPRLRLADFIFSRAKDSSANPGAIYVKRGEEYLGKVINGQFAPTRACTAETQAEIIKVAADPHAAAVAYGFATARCSCCGLTLTNKLSRELGIGPICRAKFGWG